jgi:lipoprotein NlpD
VYTGNGIKGYGNLVIIKHNDDFLTAYAHTSKILVKESNSVVKGQVIANLGDTDSIKPILHFQVRKNGKSVDPEKYIP